MTTDRDLRPRRFSEGVEHTPSLASSARVGGFADGMLAAESPAVTPVGTFADGQVLRPDAPGVRRVGTFADQFLPPAKTAPVRPRRGVAHGGARPEPA